MKLSTWHLRTGSVVAAWLVALAVVAAAHEQIPQSPWLLVHLLGLGAATNAILIWSWYFTEAMLKMGRDQGRRTQTARLAGLNAGAVTVVAGVLTDTWQATAAGASVVGVVALWHGAAMAHRLRHALPSRFGPMVRFYAAAGLMLPIGAGLGAAMAWGRLPGDWYSRFIVAHAMLNVLGWIGLTVLGTLVTLWATILRTRIGSGVEDAAKRGLPALIAALAVAVGGALGGLAWLTAAGVAAYTAAVGYVLWPHLDEARRKKPLHFPPLSVLAGVAWLAGSLVTLTVGMAVAASHSGPAAWSSAEDTLRGIVPALVAGFLAQVLLGALSYLMPVVLGSRPSATQQATKVLDTLAVARIAMVNAALLLAVLPTPPRVQQFSWIVVVVGLAAFIPLLVRAWVMARRAGSGPMTPPDRRARVDHYQGRRLGHALAGLAVAVLVAAAGVAVDPAAAGLDSGAAAQAAGPDGRSTGETTTVALHVQGMRFVGADGRTLGAGTPIEVPRGDNLIIELTNTGDQRHDLVLANGARSPRLAVGQSARIDAGVIDGDVDGWCDIAGHRQMGMVLRIDAVGADESEPATGPDAARAGGAPVPGLPELLADPGPGFRARDASVAPAVESPGAGPTVHRVTLDVRDEKIQVAPGFTQTLWPYGIDGQAGTVPGPVLRGKVGDTFEITLRNDATMDHSIDFHAGSLAPDGPMRSIAPGESLTYTFTATKSGIWLYHCSTMPMSLHIANGMFGAVVIDPPDLPPVDEEYVLVQSEEYLGADGAIADQAKINAERPDLVVFNGYPNQYDHDPLTAKAGERVRIWVLAAGPNDGTTFHVIGGQFDTVWKEGAYLLRPGNPSKGGSQALDLGPAQGGFVELTFPEAGHYPFVDHSMVDAERGAHGIFRVTD
ncbi:multicopper oxidase domain-containing protein [Tomitella fengzijianii]|uniref:Copper-containing nitrite reductase n=1 Tax=Tomitella fengzijianii TaxID=2597660 RepID=A0A516X160_9ACTN|nr:multicopper oxidase domain-containing protein [Tomitella fengzijianii]QDQ96824.1 copper oxidase [Tomitella fengzijianii]